MTVSCKSDSLIIRPGGASVLTRDTVLLTYLMLLMTVSFKSDSLPRNTVFPQTLTVPHCSRSFFVQLFVRIAGVSYGRFMATRCRLAYQRIFRNFGDRQEGRDLNGETVSS